MHRRKGLYQEHKARRGELRGRLWTPIEKMECTLMEGQTWGVRGRYAKIMLINKVPIKHSIVSAVMQTIEAHM